MASPSAVQAGPPSDFLSRVSGRDPPPGTASSQMSPSPEPPPPRRNATVRPSGEKAGRRSPRYPGGGVVSRLSSRVSTSSRKMPTGSSAFSREGKARLFPSGDHVSEQNG